MSRFERVSVVLGIINLLLLIIAGFAAGYAAFYSSKQADYAQKQWKTAEDTAKRQLRAYLGIGSFLFLCLDCGEIRSEPLIVRNAMHSKIENSGQTPAYDVDAAFNISAPPDGQQSWPNDHKFENFPNAISESKGQVGGGKNVDFNALLPVSLVPILK